MDACDDVIRAAQVEIVDLKALHQADQVLLRAVQDERDRAYNSAEMEHAPWIPTEVIAVTVFMLGVVAGKLVLR